MKRPTIPGAGASGTPPRKGEVGSAGAQPAAGSRVEPGGTRWGEKPGRSDSPQGGERPGRSGASRGPESRLLDGLLRTEKARRTADSSPGESSLHGGKVSRPTVSVSPAQGSRAGRGQASIVGSLRTRSSRPASSTQASSMPSANEAVGRRWGSRGGQTATSPPAGSSSAVTGTEATAGPPSTAASANADAASALPESETIPGRFAVWRQLRRARGQLRRVEHDEVRRFTRRSRLRRRMVWGTVAGVVLVIGGLLVTLFSPAMSLKTIQIQGGDAAVQQAVQQGLSAQIGRPLPLVSMSRVDSVVQGQARVLSYTARIEPPSTISIALVLRTPLAVVQQGATWSVVDSAGVVLSTSAAQPAGLPALTFGGDVRDPKASSSFLAAAEVLSALPASLRGTVSLVSAASADSVVLTGPGGASYIFGGTDKVAYKAQVLAALLKAAPGQAIYDVSSPDAPVTN